MTTSSRKSHNPSADRPETIHFVDLAAQQARIRPALERAMLRVLDHGAYIMGPEAQEFEQRLAAFCGSRHAIGCSSGTDALLMVLIAKRIGPGDAVICPAFTFTATAEAIALVGAAPVFADVSEDTFNIDVNRLDAALVVARTGGLSVKAIIAVDLFGQPADYDGINSFAKAHGLWVLADAAQSFGASYKGGKVGALGHATATSFFPAKPLGCYGDGGAIFTDDEELAATLESIRVHGKGADKYDNVRIGINGRLDTLQAAILIEKLNIFPEEIESRNRVAAQYTSALADIPGLETPHVVDGSTSVWAQYTLRVPPQKRTALSQSLAKAGIPTAIYYPKPLHRQTAYCSYPVPKHGLPVSERLSAAVLSLPMHPYLERATVARIADCVDNAMSDLS